ncbi:MAG: lipopolysaccharide biosynthesis protein [Acidimicrobiia bacterium]|nr:lipopolysaccharide biosynthesis protein [Acidimicrobiia bacterium]
MDPIESTSDVQPAARGTLREAALGGGRWVAIENLFLQGLQTVTTLILARVLDEDDFGIIALILLVNGLFVLVTEFGLGAALVQRQERVDDVYLATSFWTSLGLGLIAGGAVAALAGPIAASFNTPEATPFLRFGALALPLGLATSIPSSQLARKLRFKARSLVKMGATTIYLVVTVVLAVVYDLGAWAVVIGWISRGTFALAASMFASRYWPKLKYSVEILKDDLSFNAGFLGSRVSGYLAKNADYWVVGRFAADGALGQYYIAYVLPSMIRQRITLVVQQSLFPVLSRAMSQLDRFGAAFLQTLQFVTLTTSALLVGLAAVADIAVPVVFGSKWISIVAPTSVLAFSSVFDAQVVVARVVILSAGKPMWNLVLGMVRVAILGVMLIWAWEEQTLVAVAIAVLVSSVLGTVAHYAAALRLLRSSWTPLLKTLLPAVVPSLVMYGGVRVLRGLLADRITIDIIELALLVAAGGALYLGTGYLLHRGAFRGLYGDIADTLIPGRGKKRQRDDLTPEQIAEREARRAARTDLTPEQLAEREARRAARQRGDQ